MFKFILIGSFIAMMITLIPGCAPGQETTTTATELGKMLSSVPYAFLEKYDISYSNLGKAKELYGAGDVDTLEQFNQLPEGERAQFIKAWNELAGMIPAWNSQGTSIQGGFASLTGFDVFSFDRTISIGFSPPGTPWIAQGNFNKELIGSKLTEQGYTKTDYGDYSYYGIRDDFETDFSSPLSQVVMGSMNRVAVQENRLVISPATEFVTGILDAIGGDTTSVMDNEMCLALASSLGDPLVAALSTPERLVSSVPDAGQARIFNYSIPDNWGSLQGYEMAALGYRADGDKRFLDIALYYTDKKTAKADGQEILNRMNSYSLSLLQKPGSATRFTERFQPGNPELTSSGEGWVLTIACQLISGEGQGISTVMGGNAMPMRDLLFLAADPGEYTVEK